MQALHHFEDLLVLLQGDLDVFRYPVLDLAERYGQRYREDALSILSKLEEFAGAHGETLADALKFYRAHVAETAEDRRLYQGSRKEGVLPQDLRFKRHYLFALTLSTALNRSRYELFLDYRKVIGEHVRKGISILEIGAGNCLDARFASSYGKVCAYEKNELSQVWHGILNLEETVDLHIEEYRFDQPQAYDLVTMIELLEHLADPVAYLKKTSQVLRHGGLAYLTFAIRMPQIDHLYDFGSIDECRGLLDQAGLTILHEQCMIDTFRPFEESERWQLAKDPRQAVIYCCLARRQEDEELGVLLSEFNEGVE